MFAHASTHAKDDDASQRYVVLIFVAIALSCVACSRTVDVLCHGSPVTLEADAKNCGRCDHDCGEGQCIDSLCQPFPIASGQDFPKGIAVDDEYVYWATSKNMLPSNEATGTIMRAPKRGGSPVTLATQQARPARLAVDDENIYWVTLDGGSVMKLPKSGGVPVELAMGGQSPYEIVVDETNAYWTDSIAGTVKKVPIAGGKSVALATEQKYPLGIALVDNEIYWTNQLVAEVMSVPLEGGNPSTLVPANQGEAFGVSAPGG